MSLSDPFFFFLIEIKVIERICFENKQNIVFFCALDYRGTAKEFNKVWGKPHLFLVSFHWQLQPLWQKNDIPTIE